MEELTAIKTAEGREFKPWVDADKLQQIVSDPASVTAVASEIASGKQAIASAINAKGGSASATDSFSELAQNVEAIPNFSDMVKLAGIIAGGNYDKNALQGHNENVKYGKTEIIDNIGAFDRINVDYCFRYWDLLLKVKLPNVTSISSYAFQGCTALQEVNFPLLTSIGSNAFRECAALQEVNFLLLTSISGENHFQGCASLKDVTIVGFTAMSRGMFLGCSSLRSVKLPTVTTNTNMNTNVPFHQCFNLRNIELGTLVNFSTPFYSNQANLRNITIGADTNINLPFQQWTATNVIAEGQSGIDELNTNLYNNLLTKLYDHSQDGVTRTLRIGWLANVSAENIAYANAKGWTLTT